MTILNVTQNFISAEKTAYDLPEWRVLKQAKSDLKRAFHKLDTTQFSMDDFFVKISTQCGEKTAKKVKEFTVKEHSSFCQAETTEASLPDSFISAAKKLEETTKVISQQPAYQRYRSEKKAFKKFAKEAKVDLTLQLGTDEARALLASEDIDKAIAKINYWKRKQQ